MCMHSLVVFLIMNHQCTVMDNLKYLCLSVCIRVYECAF